MNGQDVSIGGVNCILMAKYIQCTPFITCLIITQIWIKHGYIVAPKFFSMEFYKGIIGK